MVLKPDCASVKCFFFLLFTDVCLSCTICRCDYEEDETVFELPCSHLFHPQCVTTWLKMVISILHGNNLRDFGWQFVSDLYFLNANWKKRAKLRAKTIPHWGGRRKKSASEASREVVWGGTSGGTSVTLSPSTGHLSARLARRCFCYLTPFLPFFPSCGAWFQASWAQRMRGKGRKCAPPHRTRPWPKCPVHAFVG